jgi:predicted dehydrogenase
MAARRAIAWLGLRQAPFVRAVARRAGLELVGVGLGEAGDGAALAQGMGCPLVDDLRGALLSSDVEVVWIARAGDFGEPRQSAADARALAGAGARGVRVVASEPLPTRVQDLSLDAWRDDAPAWVGLPLGLGCVRDLASGVESLGGVRSAMVRVETTASHASLATALVGAMELIDEVLGEPETVHGAYASAARAAGVHAMPGERVSGVHGEVFATLRFGSGRGAGLWCSDAAPGPSFSLAVLGGAGRATARADERGEDLTLCRDGEALPAQESAAAPRARARVAGSAVPGSGATLFSGDDDWLARHTAREIVRVLGGTPSHRAPHRAARALALAQACLLSVRTGQAESPELFLRDVEGRG